MKCGAGGRGPDEVEEIGRDGIRQSLDIYDKPALVKNFLVESDQNPPKKKGKLLLAQKLQVQGFQDQRCH